MEEVYIAVQKIQQAKTLEGRVISTSGGLHSRSPRHQYRKVLRKLTGPDCQRAFEKGLCLRCCRSGRYISDCKEVKKTLKKF
eukprot:3616785-Rhodomonas_salina.1